MSDSPDSTEPHEELDLAAGVPTADPFGGGGMPDLGGLLESAQQMMAGVQAAADEVVQGTAGGGAVAVSVDGHFHFHNVSIAASAIDPDDPSLLEDLVLAALRDASEQLQSRQHGAMGGLHLGGLGGILGGGS